MISPANNLPANHSGEVSATAQALAIAPVNANIATAKFLGFMVCYFVTVISTMLATALGLVCLN